MVAACPELLRRAPNPISNLIASETPTVWGGARTETGRHGAVRVCSSHPHVEQTGFRVRRAKLLRG